MDIRRRQVLKTLGALTCLATPGRTQPARAASPAEALVGGDYCAAGIPSRPLVLPTGDGRFARLAPDGAPLTMRASTIAGTAGPWTQGFAVEHRGTRFVNPTLVFKRGERVRIALENALRNPRSCTGTGSRSTRITTAPPCRRWRLANAIRTPSTCAIAARCIGITRIRTV